MLFNSIDFIVFFTIIIFAVYLIRVKKYQHVLLLVVSYFFFYYSSNYLILLLIFSTVLDYIIGGKIADAINISRKKVLLIISLAGNLGLLGFFKYVDFAILQFNILGNSFDLAQEIPLLNIALPVGISFYTFQTISYTVDIYRGKLKPSDSFLEFALFVSFFPQLVAGPIVRASVFLPQLRAKIDNLNFKNNFKQIVIHNSNLKIGITLMALGFFKKMFFADNIAPLVNAIFTNPVGSDSFTIILGAIAFGIQIYGDFSGYSDIAIGAALILGFKLPINFNKPYFAISPSDFWRRWHISLSSWLKDYLYIPLGGNKKSKSRTYLNLATVMLLGGLWHGAGWNFVVWGLLHGAYLAIHKLILDKFPQLKNNYFFSTKIGRICSIFVTQYFVFLAWIAFRVKDFDQMSYAMQKYVFLDFQTSGIIEIVGQYKLQSFLIVLFLILHFISYKKGNMLFTLSNLKIRYWIVFLTIIMLLILFLYSPPQEFIYFQF